MEKELLPILEFPNKFQVILFGYKINVFTYPKNLVYAATLGESQRVMRWKLIIRFFWTNTKYIAGVDNIVAD